MNIFSHKFALLLCVVQASFVCNSTGDDSPKHAAVQAHLKSLQDSDEIVRGKAAGALGRMGEKAVEAVPFLIERLGDKHPYVRDRAWEALFDIGLQAWPSLLQAAKSKDVRIRLGAMTLLTRLPPPDDHYEDRLKQLIPMMMEALNDTEVDVRLEAIGFLGGFEKKSIPILTHFLKTERDVEVRLTVICALGAFRQESKPAAPLLVEILRENKEGYSEFRDTDRGRLFWHSLWTLEALGPESVTIFKELLKDPDEILRSIAIDSLVTIKAPVAEIVPLATDALTDKSAKIRWTAARTLSTIGLPATPAVPRLKRALADPSARVRLESARALQAIDPTSKEPVDVLEELLVSGKEADIRRDAAYSLAKMGPNAAAALQSVLAVLGDKAVHEAALEAVLAIDPKQEKTVVAALIDLSKDRDTELRIMALQSIAGMKGKATAAAPVVIDALGDPSPSVRETAANILGKLEGEGKKAIPNLTVLLRDPSWDVRISAARAITHLDEQDPTGIGTMIAWLQSEKDPRVQISVIDALWTFPTGSTKKAVPVLVQVLDRRAADPSGIRTEEETRIRKSAASSLTWMGRVAKEAVPSLIQILRAEPDDQFRLLAVKGLGNMGSAASDAIPALEDAKDDMNPKIRSGAHEALRRIRQKK